MNAGRFFGFLVLLAIVGCTKSPVVNILDSNGMFEFKEKASVTVSSEKELRRALRSTNRNIRLACGTISIESGKAIEVPKGTYIKGTLDQNGKRCSKIYCPQMKCFPMLEIVGDNVVLEDFVIEGPDTLVRKNQMKSLAKKKKFYSLPNSCGVRSSSKGLFVRSCEIFGWSYAGVYLREGASGRVEKCSIHHNQRSGLGYGINVSGAVVYVYDNDFDYNRHDIASSGVVGSSYYAGFNRVGANGTGHSFDVHGGEDRKDGSKVAGDYFHIHNNTFLSRVNKPILIRGTPLRVSVIEGNKWEGVHKIDDFVRGVKDQIMFKNNNLKAGNH